MLLTRAKKSDRVVLSTLTSMPGSLLELCKWLGRVPSWSTNRDTHKREEEREREVTVFSSSLDGNFLLVFSERSLGFRNGHCHPFMRSKKAKVEQVSCSWLVGRQGRLHWIVGGNLTSSCGDQIQAGNKPSHLCYNACPWINNRTAAILNITDQFKYHINNRTTAGSRLQLSSDLHRAVLDLFY